MNNKEINVIFDMDGVILDSEKACLSTWSEAAAKYGIPNVREVFEKCIGTNKYQTRQIVKDAYTKDFGEGIEDKLLKESSALFHERYDDGKIPLKEGVFEILDFLKEKGIKTGLASSTALKTVERELTEAGVIDYFDMVIGGDSVTISKPNPEIYLLACEKMGVKPEDTYAIEDSFNGIRSAKAAGMRPLMVPDIIPANEEMVKLSEVICRDLFDTIDYLNSVLEG